MLKSAAAMSTPLTILDEALPRWVPQRGELRDAWVLDMYRSSRFVSRVQVVTFKDVNIEELPKADIDLESFRKGPS